MVHKMLLITWLFHICPICWAWVYLHKIKSHKRKQMHFHEEHQRHLKTLLDTFMTPNSKMAGFFLKFSLYIFLLVWRTYTMNITYDLELQWRKSSPTKGNSAITYSPTSWKAVQTSDAAFPIFWNFVWGTDLQLPIHPKLTTTFKNAESTSLTSGSHI